MVASLNLLPALEPIIEVGVICAKDKHNVKPALWEEITAMVVNNHAPIHHLVLQFIHNLVVKRPVLKDAKGT